LSCRFSVPSITTKMVKPRKGALIQTLVCPPFGVCGQGFPLAILRLPGRPHGAGLRRSRSALAPGCHGVPAGPSGRLREGEECSGHYHPPPPHSVTCHVWPLTLPVRSRPLSKQTGTAQSRCSTRASAERERRRPPVGVWWGVVIARTFPRCVTYNHAKPVPNLGPQEWAWRGGAVAPHREPRSRARTCAGRRKCGFRTLYLYLRDKWRS